MTIAFLAAAAPFVVLEDRLFLRYGYFAHAGHRLANSGNRPAAHRGLEEEEAPAGRRLNPR